MAALYALLHPPRHVVAEVVEAELVVGAVGHIGGVLLTALVRIHVGQDHADLQAEEPVDPAHPLGVVPGQVVVHGDDVDALAAERIQIGGQHGGQRFALAGLHLSDVAEVQGRAAHELNVEMTLPEHSGSRLADRGEGLGHQLVQRLAVCMPLLELIGHGP